MGCQQAKDKGSTDNITVVVVFLRDDINLSSPTTLEEEGENTVEAHQDGDSDLTDDHHASSAETNNQSSVTQNDDVTTDAVSALESGIVGLHIDPLKKDEILENNWIIYNSVKNHINRHMKEKIQSENTSYVQQQHTKSVNHHSHLPQTFLQKKGYHHHHGSFSNTNNHSNTHHKHMLAPIQSFATIHQRDSINSQNERLQLPSIKVESDFKPRQPQRRISMPDIKQLGHRALSPRNKGLPKLPFHTAVVTPNCDVIPSPTPSPNRLSPTTTTDIMITNSLSSKLKPLKHKTRDHWNPHGDVISLLPPPLADIKRRTRSLN